MSESPRAMTDRQFEALLGACHDRRHRNARRDWMLFLFLGRTGLRVSEALALTPGDLLLTDDPPCVRVRTLKRRGPAKDRAPELVDIEPTLARALAHYIRWCRNWQPFSRGRCLFPGSRDPTRSIRRHQAHALFKRYARRAGLPTRLTLHSLRHYRATAILAATRDVEYARMQLRHRSLETTQRYLHHTAEQRRRYLDLLEGEPEQ